MKKSRNALDAPFRLPTSDATAPTVPAVATLLTLALVASTTLAKLTVGAVVVPLVKVSSGVTEPLALTSAIPVVSLSLPGLSRS